MRIGLTPRGNGRATKQQTNALRATAALRGRSCAQKEVATNLELLVTETPRLLHACSESVAPVEPVRHLLEACVALGAAHVLRVDGALLAPLSTRARRAR
jgi:hypothetical protein